MLSDSAPRGLRRRHVLAALASLAAAGCAAGAGAARLSYLGEARVPYRQDVFGTVVGGLSAIDYDPRTGLYDLLSDDRSDHSPARLYRARIEVSEAGVSSLEFAEVVTLKRPDGRPWPNRAHAEPGVAVPDPEGFRRLPNGHLLWTDEGDFHRGFPPAIHECRADGVELRQFPLPAHFAMGPGHGARDNLAFEGVTLTPDGQHAWVAMENALFQDGSKPTPLSPGGPCRFTLFDLRSGQAVRQIAYGLDPIFAAPVEEKGWADNGVSEILMVDAQRLWVLERAYVAGSGLSLRIYEIDTTRASDTLALDRLAPGNHVPATKTLVADLRRAGLARLDNTEGMTWGPRLPDGRATLVVVSDDNFNPAQITQIAAFAVHP